MKTFVWLKSKKDKLESEHSDNSDDDREEVEPHMFCS
jgi:hypothetical protein